MIIKGADAEIELIAKLKKKGWRVLKDGWPDIFSFRIDSNGDIHFFLAEAKNYHCELRENQIEMLSVLTKIGLPCYVYVSHGGKLVEFEKYLKKQNSVKPVSLETRRKMRESRYRAIERKKKLNREHE